ncbi:hypothetical protein Y888_15520 [Mixta calida B021323]|nr:hypothetical protein Y888_15520 [Mixta calida B021323]
MSGHFPALLPMMPGPLLFSGIYWFVGKNPNNATTTILWMINPIHNLDINEIKILLDNGKRMVRYVCF